MTHERPVDKAPTAPICAYLATWPASAERIISDTALLRSAYVDSCFEQLVDTVAAAIRAGGGDRMFAVADSIASRCDGAFSDYMADVLVDLFAHKPSDVVRYMKDRGDCHMRTLLVAGLTVAMKTSQEVNADSIRAWGRRGAGSDSTRAASQWVQHLLRDLNM